MGKRLLWIGMLLLCIATAFDEFPDSTVGMRNSELKLLRAVTEPASLVLYAIACIVAFQSLAGRKSPMARLAVAIRVLIVSLGITLVFDIAARSVQASIIASNTSPNYVGGNPWITTFLDVGVTGNGTLTINAGSDVNNSGDGRLGYSGNSYTSGGTVTGAGSTWTNNSLYVAYGHTATLDITYGGSVSNTSGYIGRNSRTGTVTVGGGTGTSTWTNSDRLNLGNSGTGFLNITGGGTVSNTYAHIGEDGNGTVNVGGGTGSSTWDNSGLRVGNNTGSTGILNITGGGTVTSLETDIGVFGANGTVTIGGGTGTATLQGSPTHSNVHVGYDGTGTLNITGGGNIPISNYAYIGYSIGGPGSPANGTVNVGGGTGTSTWTTGYLYVGYNPPPFASTGTLNITSGGEVSAGKLEGGNATSSIKLNGGLLRITTTDSASNTLNLLSAGGTIDIPTGGTTFTLTSPMSGTGGLTKTGVGSLELTGANTYTGATTISAGKLLVNNASGSATGTGAVTVNSGGALGGNGTIAGNVTNSGTVAPGASPGTLNINGDYTQDATSKLQLELASVTAFDQLKIGGAAALAGTLEVLLLGGYLPVDGTQFDILDWGSRSETFTTISLPTLPTGIAWDTSQLYAAGTLAVIGLAGDFNVDGAVDAADYVTWRKNAGTSQEYNLWRANFGRTFSGSGSAAPGTVPESRVIPLLVSLSVCLASCQRKARAKIRCCAALGAGQK